MSLFAFKTPPAAAPQADAAPAAPAPRPRAGLRLGPVNADAVARAEAALAELSSQLDGWLREEVRRLDAAHEAARAAPTAESLAGLYARAHDLKGLGATYGFPLVGRIAASLCRVMDAPDKRAQAPAALIDAHVEAIRTTIGGDMRAVDHPEGVRLADGLEQRTRALVG